MGPSDFNTDRHLPPHRDRRGQGRLGPLRLREDARLSLGHLPGRAERRPEDPLRRQLGPGPVWNEVPGEMRGRLRRLDRHPGRHRAGLGRAAADARSHRAVALRHAVPVPGQRRGGPPPLGHGLPAALATSARMAATRRTSLLQRRSGDPDKPPHPRRPSTTRSTPGWTSSASRPSPTATESTSSQRSRRVGSTHWPAAPSSC